MEKASRLDSTVKRFLTMADIEVIRNLTKEEEVEALHSSWITVRVCWYLSCFTLIRC